MRKLLLIQPRLPHYRIPIFNGLAEKYDVTVLHSGKIVNGKGLKFKQHFSEIKRIGPFFRLKLNLYEFCKNYDVVLSEGNIRHVDRNILILSPFRKFKWINWGIGVSADYKSEFDANTKFDFIRHYLAKKSEANVFYSNYPVKKYIKAGIDKQALFVANNTVEVHFDERNKFNKISLLFIGTLYKQKKIYELLDSYKKALDLSENFLPLIIIGDGEEFNNIKTWITDHNLEENIHLKGAIFDTNELEQYFRQAYACISPGQAGLSVLTSMGNGTPFITKRSAITGGEIFNIKNKVNGITYLEDNELVDILLDINSNKKKYIKMGKNARSFYLNERMPEKMIARLILAIEYALNNK